jgi:hypothetical protein
LLQVTTKTISIDCILKPFFFWLILTMSNNFGVTLHFWFHFIGDFKMQNIISTSG